PTNPTGAIDTGPITYLWQAEVRPGSGVFETIILVDATRTRGEAIGAPGPRFTVRPDLAGLALRVLAVYQDGNGVLEEVFSAATAPVANINAAPVGTLTITDTTPTEGSPLTAVSSITDADGTVNAVF